MWKPYRSLCALLASLRRCWVTHRKSCLYYGTVNKLFLMNRLKLILFLRF